MDDVFIEVVLLHLSNWKQNLTKGIEESIKEGYGTFGRRRFGAPVWERAVREPDVLAKFWLKIDIVQVEAWLMKTSIVLQKQNLDQSLQNLLL